MAAVKPVILLAFANDPADGVNYLRNLPEEERRIRAALEYAETKGLCEFEVRYNATLDDILAAFQQPKLRGRIAVFHYGGHADSYDLLFQSRPGDLQRIDARGFAAFLAEQRSLQLVFLNACTTEPQIDSLLAANVQVVIATSQEVDDGVAAELAARFYTELAHGASIGASYRQAVAALRSQRGDDPGAFYAPNAPLPAEAAAGDAAGAGGQADGATPDAAADVEAGGSASGGFWPWLLRTRRGAEVAIEWSLPQAAGDPLFGLPSLPAKPLPDSPYQRGLDYYTRDLAELFFGRGRQIRDLYQRVTAPGRSSVILYYGQSGVGKSSLLDAGLAPRLEATHAVIYARRDRALGLLGTLLKQLPTPDPAPSAANSTSNGAADASNGASKDAAGATAAVGVTSAVGSAANGSTGGITVGATATAGGQASLPAAGAQASAPAALLHAWLAAEARLGKPLVLILDQVEEVFSRRNPDQPQELEQFMSALGALEGGGEKPAGVLLLGFRKERLAEIEAALRTNRVDFAKLFLEPLDAEGIQEIFWGPLRSARLQAKYNLAVDDDLPELVAHDLTADPDSPVAPTLNILLRKLWAAAVAQSAAAPRFTSALYEQLRRDGILLDDFLRQQTATLAAEQPDAVASGLLLDLWAFHTTPLGTSDQRDAAELRAAYGERPSLEALILRSKELYVLADPAGDTTGGDGAGAAAASDGGTRLAHDTLAPLVRRDFATSTRPGQQALRLLESRAIDWQDGRSGPLLDDAALAVLDKGLAGMRNLSEAEQRLLVASKAAQIERRRRGRLNRGAAIAAALVVLALLAATLFSGYNGQLQSERADREAIERQAAEERASREAAERQAAEERSRTTQLSNQLANERQRVSAAEAQRNESQRLAALAEQQLAVDPVFSLHLALAALPNDPSQPAIPEAEYVLRQAVLGSRERAYITTTVTAAEAVAVRGNHVAVGGQSPAVYTLDLQPEGFPLPADFTDIVGLHWGNDGRLLGWSRNTAWVLGGGEPQRFDLPAGDDEIRCAEWQPAQQWVAICTYGALYAWQPALGRVITLTEALDVPGAFTEGRGAAWSVDGRLLAGWGSRLVVWDSSRPATPAQVYDQAPEANLAVPFAFWLPEDNSLLAGWFDPSASGLHLARRRTAAEDLEVIALPADLNRYTPVNAIYAPDPQTDEPRLLLWSTAGLLALYDSGGQQIAAADVGGAGLNGVVLAPDGRTLVAYSGDGTAAIYAVDDLHMVVRLDATRNFTAGALEGAVWLDAKTLLLADLSGVLYYVNLNSQDAGNFAVTRLAGYSGGERLAAAARVVGGRLLTAGYGGGGVPSLRLWQVEPVLQPATAAGAEAFPPADAPLCQRLHRALPLPASWTSLSAIDWQAGDRLLVMHDTSEAAQWTLGGKAVSLPPDPEHTQIAFAPDSSRLLRYDSGTDGRLWRWDGGDWAQQGVITGSIAVAVWRPFGLLVQFEDGASALIDPDSGERHALPEGVQLSGATLIAPSLLVALRDTGVELWQVGGQSPLAAWLAPPDRSLYLADAAPDGRFLVYKDGQTGQLYVLRADAAAGKLAEIWRSEQGHVSPGDLHLNPTLPLLAVINDYVLSVVDLDRGETIWSSTSAAAAAAQAFLTVQWSTDGQYLITQAQLLQASSVEDTIGVWRWDASQRAPVLLQTMRAATLVGVRPDMQWLLASERGPASLTRLVAYPLLLDSHQLRQDAPASCLLVRPPNAAQRQAFLNKGR